MDSMIKKIALSIIFLLNCGLSYSETLNDRNFGIGYINNNFLKLDGTNSPMTGNLNMGGYSLIGNNTSGGNLTFSSTSHATKGKIIFGTSAYDEVNNRLGIKNASPLYEVDVTGSIRATSSYLLVDGASSITRVGSPNARMRLYNQFGVSLAYFNGAVVEGAFLDANGNFSVGTIAASFSGGSGIEIERVGTATLRIENAGTGPTSLEMRAANNVIQWVWGDYPYTIYPNYGSGLSTTVLGSGFWGFNVATPLSLIHANTTLSAATGNEIAYQLNYTTNKLTSGNDTGLLVAMTDTASPGTSYLYDGQVGGSSYFNVSNGGTIQANRLFGFSAGSTTTLELSGTRGGTANAISVRVGAISTYSATSGTTVPFKIEATYNQTSGTAANTDLLIDRTETAVGSGAQLFADFQVGSVSKFSVSNAGTTTLAGDLLPTGAGSGLPYGSCYGYDIAWVQATAAQNTWYKLSDADMVDGPLNLFTHDGNGKLTATNAGTYRIDMSISMDTTGTNKYVEYGVSIDGAAPAMYQREFFGAASELQHGSLHRIITLTAGQTIELAIRTTDTGTPNLEVNNLSMTAFMIGG